MSDTATVLEVPASTPAPASAPASPPASPPSGDAGAPSAETVVVDPAPAAPAAEPDWRTEWAGNDEKLAKRLERFSQPKDVLNSYLELERALHDSGRVKLPGEDTTPEEKAAFARTVGIPESFDGYKIEPKLPEGFEFGELDKQLLDSQRKAWHEQGGIMAMPQVQQAAIEAYANLTEEAVAQQVAVAKEKSQAARDWINENWKGDAERNTAYATQVVERYIGPVLEQFGESPKDFLHKTFEDGTRIGDYIPLLAGLARLGRETTDDPLFAEASKGGGDGVGRLQARQAEIMKLRDEGNFREYDKHADELTQINAALARHRK